VSLRSMLPILMMLAAPIAAQTSNPMTLPQSVLHTPDMIFPAVMPYLACLAGTHGLPVLKGNDGNETAFDKNDSNCLATKRRAKTEALKLIADKSVPGGATPTQYVDNALADIESYVASQHGAQVQIITIEDELLPAYSHYQACLNANASITAATADTIMSVFEQAMAACRSARASALVEGENALVKKGWDEAMRAKTAESTFATIDRSWMTRGQQLRESLLKQSR
jgi:hypothetical protein